MIGMRSNQESCCKALAPRLSNAIPLEYKASCYFLSGLMSSVILLHSCDKGLIIQSLGLIVICSIAHS